MNETINPAASIESADGGKASIGKSIKITGDLTGTEDLTIDGTVEGTVTFTESDVLIGKNGHVRANIFAKNISVEGEVKGELCAGGQVTIQSSGKVTGDIHAPRVIMQDGCLFKGSVDMEALAAPGPHKSAPGDPRKPVAKLPGTRPPLRSALPK